MTAAGYRAQLLAAAKAAAVPVVSQVAVDETPDQLMGMTAAQLRALVIVLAEAAAGDMPRLRAIAAADDDLGAETAYDLIAPDWDDVDGNEFRREAHDALDGLAPARALVLWQCQELTDRVQVASEPAGAAAA